MAGPGAAWQAGHGEAGLGADGHGMAGEAGRGTVWRGLAGHGKARQAWYFFDYNNRSLFAFSFHLLKIG